MNNDKNEKTIINAQKITGLNIDELKKSADNGSLDKYLSDNLPSDTVVKLKNILSDKSKTQSILSTPQAKELLKKLTEGK